MPANSSVILISVMLIIASVLMVIGSIASIFLCRYHCFRKNDDDDYGYDCDDDGVKMLQLIVMQSLNLILLLNQSIYNYCTGTI